jgi:hypothetical protein
MVLLSCFAPILACGRSFFFVRPRANRPAPISVEEMALDLALDSEGVAPQPPPTGRWIDAIADPNFRAVQVMDAMRGSLQGTLWLHLAVKNSRVRTTFAPQYELFPIYWIKAGKSVNISSSLEDVKASDEPIGDPKISVDDFECIPEDYLSEEQVSHDDPLFGLCALCMEAPASLSLLPCRHDNFCQMCMLRIVCYWNQSHGPGCPICRTPIKTIIIIDDTLPSDTNADTIAAMFFEPQIMLDVISASDAAALDAVADAAAASDAAAVTAGRGGGDGADMAATSTATTGTSPPPASASIVAAGAATSPHALTTSHSAELSFAGAASSVTAAPSVAAAAAAAAVAPSSTAPVAFDVSPSVLGAAVRTVSL